MPLSATMSNSCWTLCSIQVLKAPHGGWEENVTVAYESGAVEAMTVVIGLHKVCRCACSGA